MTRMELINIRRKIVQAKGTESELDKLMQLFDQNIPHPKGSNLFFYPEDYNTRKNNIEKYSPSVEEIVDKCLSYVPVRL